ncbi:MAG: helix-turn-helix domain-containing protein [Gluconobacter cerinus]
MIQKGPSPELPARIIPLATLATPSQGLQPVVQRRQGASHETIESLLPYFNEDRALFAISRHTGGNLYIDREQLIRAHHSEKPALGHEILLINDSILISVTKGGLLNHLPVLSGLPVVHFETQSGPGRFLLTCCELILDGALEASPSQTQTRLFKHLTDLLITTLLDSLDLELSVAGRRKHRQKHIRSYIESRLQEPDLTPKSIANAYGISSRALYLLFDGEPGAVSGWILSKRLERIYKDLQSAEYTSMAIAEIAAKHGFRNAAHFSRRFRQKFGLSPRELRQRKLTG